MNADLEAAQALGFGDSFISTNDPEYSGIPANTDSETILSYIFKGCHTHVKQAVNEFRHLVPHKDYQRLMNFPYMKKEELPEFDMFIKSLKNKKISPGGSTSIVANGFFQLSWKACLACIQMIGE
ncbi:hypothetical protein BDQ17DRAFT_1433438 [Cyathus striatus]|nr:hypothetical protein BDQ17DRAFT_1433438 [Cyathus striatus]